MIESIIFCVVHVALGYVLGLLHVTIRLNSILKEIGMDDEIPSKDERD